jgi:hypothetical protein
MFRKVKEETCRVYGVLVGTLGELLYGVELELQVGDNKHITTTDHRGRFYFANVQPGSATIEYGLVKKAFKITRKDVKRGSKDVGRIRGAKRLIDLSRAPLWEVADALGVDLPKARTIQLQWLGRRTRTAETFKSVMEQHGLQYAKLKKRITILRRSDQRTRGK